MNKRIEDLAREARGQPTNLPTYVTLDWEKFAELILRDCISLLSWQMLSSTEGPYNIALSLAQKNIKEHFGIKEENNVRN